MIQGAVYCLVLFQVLILHKKNHFPIFEKPLGKISYNVRAADKIIMLIAGYVHSLYLNFDGKEDRPIRI